MTDIQPPTTATIDGRWVHFDCDDFEIDAKPAPHIVVSLDIQQERKGRSWPGGPSSAKARTAEGARHTALNRVRNGRSSHAWTYEQTGDDTWTLRFAASAVPPVQSATLSPARHDTHP